MAVTMHTQRCQFAHEDDGSNEELCSCSEMKAGAAIQYDSHRAGASDLPGQISSRLDTATNCFKWAEPPRSRQNFTR
jgi:hypothetical protein